MTGLLLSGCSGGLGEITAGLFPPSQMGVSASPRVVSNGDVPRGGGRAQVGRPYQVAGRWYEPRHQPDLDVTGRASWYGADFHGRLTANGEVFDQTHLSGAHPTLPLPSYVRVTNLENGVSTLVRINDRGPFSSNRIIDLSHQTAHVLGFVNDGLADVRVQYVGPAPLEGDDFDFLVASINSPTYIEDPSDVMVAYQPASPQPATETVASAPLDAIGALIGADQPVAEIASAYAPAAFAPVGFDVFAAHAAAEASASAPLATWMSSLDQDSRAVSIELGTFVDADLARDVAERFALLAAVDMLPATLAGFEATQLRLSVLKPGVTHADVTALATELGVSISF